MSSNFECFVAINDKKHTIIINKDINCVNFGDVYQQIRKIDSKHDISYETHVFEIFDFDINSFKRLTDSKQLIRCLARIRVLPSFATNVSIFDTNGSQLSETKAIKRHINQNNNNDNRFNNTFSSVPQKTTHSSGRESQRSRGHRSTINADKSPEIERNNEFSNKFKPIINNSENELNVKTKQNKSNDSFKSEGLVISEDKTYCQLCAKQFSSYAKGIEHINSIEHSVQRNRCEDNYEDIDKQFLAQIHDKNDLKYILCRKTELKRFSAKEKQEFIKHGIRVKDGFGSQTYVCFKCKETFEDSNQMLKHFKGFYEITDWNSGIDSNSDHKNVKKSKLKRNKYKSKSESKHLNFKLPKEMVDEVTQLVKQGFSVLPKTGRKFVLKCRFCDIWCKNIAKAIQHMQTEEHNKWKTEMPFKGIDRLIVTETATNSDVEVLLTRIQVIRELPISAKEEFLSHGIKVKDGFGANAYVCSKCNLMFDNKKVVKRHLTEFNELKNTLLKKSTKDSEKLSENQIELLDKQMNCSNQYIDELFRNEGIKYRKYDKSVQKQLSQMEGQIQDVYYFCVFCNTNFYSKETALYHLNRPFHSDIKRGEYMTPIEAMFSVKSDRIDELDIAFARMEALYRLDNKTKIDFRDKGIRLKDGIGANAYVCLKCNVSIDCQTIDSAFFSIIRHISSRNHTVFASV